MTKKYIAPTIDGKEGKILLGIPRERVYLTQALDVRDNILAEMAKSGRSAGYFQAEGHRVDRNRDRIVQHFFEDPSKPEWLAMIDTDMDIPRDAILKLVGLGKPIVGGLYFHRGDTKDPFAFRRIHDTQDQYGRLVPQWVPMRDEVYEFLEKFQVPMRDGGFTIDCDPKDAVIEVDAIATGCIVIHRSVLEYLEKPIFEYKNFGTSEDLSFCSDAKEAGIPVYCDFSTVCGHYNWVPMGHAQFRSIYRGAGVNLTMYSKRDAAQWLSEFMKVDFEQAVDRIERGSAHMAGDYWNSKFGDSIPATEDVNNFYKDDMTGRLYLIELLHWNFMAGFTEMRKSLLPIRNMNVLEIGAGIGTVSFQFAIQQNEVVAVEINPFLRDFIRYRWDKTVSELMRKHGSLFIVGEEWKELSKDNQFDVVFSAETFEHLTEDELMETIGEIIRVLKIGGRLIYIANWNKQDGIYPMHFDHSKLMEELLKDNFRKVSDMEWLRIL